MTNVSRIAGWSAVVGVLGLAGGCDLKGEPAPYVLNLTRFEITVRVRPLLGTPTCSLLAEHVGRFSQQDYGPAVLYHLPSGDLLPLEDPEEPAPCGAAHVRIGDFERVVYWDASDLVQVPLSPEHGDESEAQALRVGGAPQQLFVSVGRVLGTTELRREEPPADCDISIGPSLAWSGLADGGIDVRGTRAGVDDCIAIDWALGPSFVCLPEVMLPFGAGDAVEVDDEPPLTSVGRSSPPAKAVRLRGPEGELTLYRALPTWPAVGLGDSLGTKAASCTPVRDACGSLTLPASVRLGMGERAGGEVVETAWSSRTQRVFLGRVERVVLTAPGCERPGPDGTRVDLAVLDWPSGSVGDDEDAGREGDGREGDGGVEGEVMR